MQVYKKIMLALDRSETDLSILRYLQLLASYYKPQLIEVLFVVPTLDKFYSDFIKKNDTAFETKKSLDDALKGELERKVKYYFPEEKPVVSIILLEGTPIKQLIKEVGLRAVDLLVVGNKKVSEGSGITGKAVSRRFKGSVLFIPEKQHTQMHRMVVPIDFSENAARALKEALAIYDQQIGASVIALNILDLYPLIHYQASRLASKFTEYAKEDVSEAWNGFCEKYQIPKDKVKLEQRDRVDGNIAKGIQQFSEEAQADLILMGSHGHSILELTLWGSNTEKLLAIEKTIPILIIR